MSTEERTFINSSTIADINISNRITKIGFFLFFDCTGLITIIVNWATTLVVGAKFLRALR